MPHCVSVGESEVLSAGNSSVIASCLVFQGDWIVIGNGIAVGCIVSVVVVVVL